MNRRELLKRVLAVIAGISLLSKTSEGWESTLKDDTILTFGDDWIQYCGGPQECDKVLRRLEDAYQYQLDEWDKFFSQRAKFS